MGFGITPDQLNSIVALWRRSSDEIAGLDCAAGDLSLAGSRSAESLRACAAAVHDAAAALSRHLAGSAAALEKFNTTTVESDRACAADLAALRRPR
ncbi:hypothetical protein Y710_13245 [Gordonia sp. QH-12]|uniref:hypothetical protein n=1 Tax=Gordonia TaxID=2053 RepID=UPI000783B5BA|nr:MULTISPECIES: hypothetical protein [Gordonia]KXT56446.1 hypothetical protein Y710_13245 [Gordonia sp. QH-12]WFN93624.1 hypothetical protein P5P27_03400 [Gordonia sihwensis]